MNCPIFSCVLSGFYVYRLDALVTPLMLWISISDADYYEVIFLLILCNMISAHETPLMIENEAKHTNVLKPNLCILTQNF